MEINNLIQMLESRMVKYLNLYIKGDIPEDEFFNHMHTLRESMSHIKWANNEIIEKE